MTYPSHTKEQLAVKLRGLYPEIDAHGIALSLEFNEKKDAWIVHFVKGGHELTTHLERPDADGCIDGIRCVYLGVQLAQLISNFEGGS